MEFAKTISTCGRAVLNNSLTLGLGITKAEKEKPKQIMYITVLQTSTVAGA
jgi:hypothetical protein